MEKDLQRRGWARYDPNPKKLGVAKSPRQNKGAGTGKSSIVWDGTLKDANKSIYEQAVNSKDNLDGGIIYAILGSPPMREGVSFKHIQHMHVLDPVWNPSAKAQVEGHAVRFCSHAVIPKSHPFLKRVVKVHVYKSIHIPGGKTNRTCNEIIYEDIIPRNRKDIEILEGLLKKASID